jgi:hypothetical protein
VRCSAVRETWWYADADAEVAEVAEVSRVSMGATGGSAHAPVGL